MNSSLTTINLLLIDDHEMFREGLARSFEREPGFKLVGQCGSSAEAMSLLAGAGDAITVLLDVDLGTHRGLEFVEAARKAGFRGSILVLTAGISGQEAVQLMRASVAGIVHKHHSTKVLCDAIRKVVSGGGVWLEEEYLTPLLRSVDRTHGAARPELTERDRTVLRHILEGLTNREIGVSLHISEGAVKASLRVLFEKLGVRTRAQLVKVALEQYKDQL
jgi:two-component system, NarL family, nitrate/nitrite response regulator NarL